VNNMWGFVHCALVSYVQLIDRWTRL